MNYIGDIIAVILGLLGVFWLTQRKPAKPYESPLTKKVEEQKQEVKEAHEATQKATNNFNDLAAKFRERFKR